MQYLIKCEASDEEILSMRCCLQYEGWVGEEALGECWTLLWGGLLEVLDTF